MRTHAEIKSDVQAARARIAELRKEMLTGIRDEVVAAGGRISFVAYDIVLEKGKVGERQLLELRAITHSVKGVDEQRTAYDCVSTDKTTPLYKYAGHNSIQEYHLDVESLSTILEVVAALEERRAK